MPRFPIKLLTDEQWALVHDTALSSRKVAEMIGWSKSNVNRHRAKSKKRYMSVAEQMANEPTTVAIIKSTSIRKASIILYASRSTIMKARKIIKQMEQTNDATS